MLFINTRPQDRASALSQALVQSSVPVSVLELPLLVLQPVEWSILLEQQFQQMPTVDVIVVVSPTAVELGMRALERVGIKLESLKSTLKWIAVGTATAACLQKYGVESEVPLVETSEGMLSLPSLATLPSASRVAFWRGLGGREFMMNHLQQLGMHVLNCVLYERCCPPKTISDFKKQKNLINTQRKYSILISSEASWLNWLALLDPQHDFSVGYYLVLGERLESVLNNYRKQHQLDFKIIQISDLKPVTIENVLARLQESS